MENSGFNLMAGVIAAAILVMGVGMYIYNSTASSISNSIDNSMSIQEIDAFNNQFTAYEGSQTGSKLKALIGTLIANSDTYQYEIEKIPDLIVVDKINESGEELENATIENEDDIDDYVANLGKIRNSAEVKHKYWLEMVYGTSGLIEEIKVYYEEQ